MKGIKKQSIRQIDKNESHESLIYLQAIVICDCESGNSDAWSVIGLGFMWRGCWRRLGTYEGNEAVQSNSNLTNNYLLTYILFNILIKKFGYFGQEPKLYRMDRTEPNFNSVRKKKPNGPNLRKNWNRTGPNLYGSVRFFGSGSVLLTLTYTCQSGRVF